MAASLTDLFTDVRNSARPNTTTVTVLRASAATNLTCNSLIGWPIASKVHFVTYQTDTNNNVVAGTQLDCYGIVSGNTITNMVVVDGTDGGNSVGDVVEMLPTAAWAQDLADGLMNEHDREGIHTSDAASTIGAFLYPIGSIYTNASVSTNPATLLGFGTWAAFGSGRVMVGIDAGQTEFDTLGETGGDKNLAAHKHWISAGTYDDGNMSSTGLANTQDTGLAADGGAYSVDDTNKTFGRYSLTAGTGTAGNLQPYITVYMWKRTA